MTRVILGIDPGTRKAGYAVVDEQGAIVTLGIEEIPSLVARVTALGSGHAIAAIALGTGTNAGTIKAMLACMERPVYLVDERETTLRARALYFKDYPPKGWRRLIPIGMQVPPRPIDDYAAVLIARRYLADEGNARTLV